MLSFTKDNNLSKKKVGGLCRKQPLHVQKVKPNTKQPPSISKAFVFTIIKRDSTILSDKNKFLPNHFIHKRKFWSNTMIPDGSLLKSFSEKYRK